MITLKTSEGDIKVRLYDETPKHRDNFTKLCSEGYYNGTLFHRVIKDFMIQGGDPDSVQATPTQMLGMGGPGYTVEAEIRPELFHRRGTLAAARQGDEVNPERRSSGSQFYISWGTIYSESQLKQVEHQRAMMAEQRCFNELQKEYKDKILDMRRGRDRDGLRVLQERMAEEAKDRAKEQGKLSEVQRKIYTTVGGIPHLDGDYTVFGEVVEGLDVVERIQKTETRRGDRPVKDIVIISTEIESN